MLFVVCEIGKHGNIIRVSGTNRDEHVAYSHSAGRVVEVKSDSYRDKKTPLQKVRFN